jgi:8-oxo-dGTP diphosphatase
MILIEELNGDRPEVSCSVGAARSSSSAHARCSVAVVPTNGAAASPPAAQIRGLPAIPVSAGALIFDRAGRLLILKPNYKSGWTIPGGVMEMDGETPWEACMREVREECGIRVREGRLACMDFRPPRPGNPGGIRFLFHCGAIDDKSLATIVIQPEEISEYRTVALRDALRLLRRPIRRRVRAATSGHGLVYLEDGLPVSGIDNTFPHSNTDGLK